jgi:hypothetical protein
MPNDDTPARRGPSPGKGIGEVGTKNGPFSSASSGLGRSKWREAGIVPRSSASVALRKPATPAAASQWPMLDFTEPSATEAGGSPSPSACVSAATSMGSPSGVAVPCASIIPMDDGSTSATESASAMARACPSTLGAVKPILREPSLLTAEPRTRARTGSPSRRASARRLRTTTPTPEPPTVPCARASKGRQWPSGEWMPPSWYWFPSRCGRRMATPPASATSHSSPNRLWHAMWMATSEVEHAVCTATLGPLRFSL